MPEKHEEVSEDDEVAERQLHGKLKRVGMERVQAWLLTRQIQKGQLV